MADLRRNAFVLTATCFGPMLVNRLDYHLSEDPAKSRRGISCDLVEVDQYRKNEIDGCFSLIEERHRKVGDGLIVVDVGANIGTHTVAWSRRMHGWGFTLAFEAQERIFYALAGNIILNNCFNARAIWSAVGAESGIIDAPNVDYESASMFGSFSLKNPSEFQPKSHGTVKIGSIALDDIDLPQLDFLKIDVEGMEMEVLQGATQTISRHRPIIVAENNFSIDEYASLLGPTYSCRQFDDMNTLMEPV